MSSLKELPNDLLLGEIADLLAEGHTVILRARGNSMLPFVRDNVDSLEIKRRDVIAAGDIVLARLKSGSYVAHRVVQVDGNRCTLKGDGNLVGVEHCITDDICGTVEKIIKPRRIFANERRVDCHSGWFTLVSKMWRKSPYLIRRVVLGVARRATHIRKSPHGCP